MSALQTQVGAGRALSFFVPLTKIDDEKRMAWGYASTEAIDSEEETIKISAIKAALPDYMKFANIREMHQLSAVGVASEAEIDGKGLWIGAHVVDDNAWKKVKARVYKGFSVGGRATSRDASDHSIITGMDLIEISLVDRPANPEALIEVFKVGQPKSVTLTDITVVGDTDLPLAKHQRMPEMQWACGIPGHHHLKKAEAIDCIEEQGFLFENRADDAVALHKVIAAAVAKLGADGLASCAAALTKSKPAPKTTDDKPAPRNPYLKRESSKETTTHFAEMKAALTKNGTPSAEPKKATTTQQAKGGHQVDKLLEPFGKADSTGGDFKKGLMTVCSAINLLQQLDCIHDCLAAEAAVEGDHSDMPMRFKTVLGTMAGLVQELAAEEIAEMLEDREERDYASYGGPMGIMYAAQNATMEKSSTPKAVADFITKTIADKKESPGFKRLTAFVESFSKTNTTLSPNATRDSGGGSPDGVKQAQIWGPHGEAAFAHDDMWGAKGEHSQKVHDLAIKEGASCIKAQQGAVGAKADKPKDGEDDAEENQDNNQDDGDGDNDAEDNQERKDPPPPKGKKKAAQAVSATDIATAVAVEVGKQFAKAIGDLKDSLAPAEDGGRKNPPLPAGAGKGAKNNHAVARAEDVDHDPGKDEQLPDPKTDPEGFRRATLKAVHNNPRILASRG